MSLGTGRFKNREAQASAANSYEGTVGFCTKPPMVGTAPEPGTRCENSCATRNDLSSVNKPARKNLINPLPASARFKSPAESVVHSSAYVNVMRSLIRCQSALP